jgi:AAA15 family ATPase/GTPase
MLRDLTIKNFRCFQDFHIDDLARVNLIVGKNNSGKTCFLEAIYLLVNHGNPNCLIDILGRRGEYIKLLSDSRQRNFYEVFHLFNGHQLVKNKSLIEIIAHDIKGVSELNLLFEENKHINETQPYQISILPNNSSSDSVMYISVGEEYMFDGPLYKLMFDYRNPREGVLISPQNLHFSRLAFLWDEISLTPKEDLVIDMLKILNPLIDRIHFSSASISHRIMIHVSGEKIPIGSMGEGVQRILSLALNAVNVENGFLLVDDIDTGLYHGAQLDMWRWIMQVAKELNIQVFATTHSWDCVAAFQEALEEIGDPAYGRLLRMERRDNGTQPVEYTAKELAIAVDHGIEVR